MYQKSHRLLTRLRTARLMSGVVAAVAIFALIGAVPAAAAPTFAGSADGSAATARFQKYGDHIFLCDHAEDGHSVAVDLDYIDEDGDHREHWRWNWWGPYKYNGCKDINLAVMEDTWIDFRVCLGDYGHPGGKPADVIESTCGDWVSEFNNS